MNFALPAATILLLLIPGLLSVQGFLGKIGRRSTGPVGQTGMEWSWLIALLIAPAIHALAACALPVLGLPAADVEAVWLILTGSSGDPAARAHVISSITSFPVHVAAYFVFVSLVALGFGGFLRWVIRTCKLDRRYKTFRFGSEWHYLFSGELRPIGQPLPDTVVVAATVNHGSHCYLYLGFLVDYWLSRDGDLIRVFLKQAIRRKLEQDRDAEEPQQAVDKSGRFYPITGDSFVINCEDVRTLNVRYLWVKPEPEGAETSGETDPPSAGEQVAE